MGLFGGTCGRCGATIAPSARTCPECGARQEAGEARCDNCGPDVGGATGPAIVDNRWRRGEEDFFTVISIEDARGFFAHEFIVEPGTQAFLLADGACLGTVGPGRFTISNLRSAQRVEAILVDVADTDLQVTVNGLLTGDPLAVDLTCRVVTRVGDPVRLLQSLIEAQSRYGMEHLRDYLCLEVQGTAQEWMSGHSVAELAADMRLRDELKVALGATLRETMARTGLELVQVRPVAFAHEYLDRVTGEPAWAYLQVSEEQAKLQGRRRLFDVMQEQELQQ